MNKDPLSIVISLIFNLNLLEENKEYNINEIKQIPSIENHWITIKKYLKMFRLIQEYCPKLDLEDSKITIFHSQIYRKLSPKEKTIVYLFINNALTSEGSINLPEYHRHNIEETINYLVNKDENERFYLSKSGLDIIKSITRRLNDLLYNQKEINEVFTRPTTISEPNIYYLKENDTQSEAILSKKPFNRTNNKQTIMK